MPNKLPNSRENNKLKLKDRDFKMKNLLKRKPSRKPLLLQLQHRLKPTLLRIKKHKLKHRQHK
jgi:hypothetical protein